MCWSAGLGVGHHVFSSALVPGSPQGCSHVLGVPRQAVARRQLTDFRERRRLDRQRHLATAKTDANSAGRLTGLSSPVRWAPDVAPLIQSLELS
jgi:hypothetical protein